MTIRYSMANRGGNLVTNRYLAAIQTNVTESTSSSTPSSNIPTSTPTSNMSVNNFHKRQRPRAITNNGSDTSPLSLGFQQQQQHFSLESFLLCINIITNHNRNHSWEMCHYIIGMAHLLHLSCTKVVVPKIAFGIRR